MDFNKPKKAPYDLNIDGLTLIPVDASSGTDGTAITSTTGASIPVNTEPMSTLDSLSDSDILLNSVTDTKATTQPEVNLDLSGVTLIPNDAVTTTPDTDKVSTQPEVNLDLSGVTLIPNDAVTTTPDTDKVSTQPFGTMPAIDTTNFFYPTGEVMIPTVDLRKKDFDDTMKYFSDKGIDMSNTRTRFALGDAVVADNIAKLNTTGNERIGTAMQAASSMFGNYLVVNDATNTVMPLSMLMVTALNASNGTGMNDTLRNIFEDESTYSDIYNTIATEKGKAYFKKLRDLYKKDTNDGFNDTSSKYTELLLSAGTEFSASALGAMLGGVPGFIAQLAGTMAVSTWISNREQNATLDAMSDLNSMPKQKLDVILETRIRPEYINDDGTIDETKIMQARELANAMFESGFGDGTPNIYLDDIYGKSYYETLSGKKLIDPSFGAAYTRESVAGDSIGQLFFQLGKLIVNPTGGITESLAYATGSFLREMAINVAAGTTQGAVFSTDTMQRALSAMQVEGSSPSATIANKAIQVGSALAVSNLPARVAGRLAATTGEIMLGNLFAPTKDYLFTNEGKAFVGNIQTFAKALEGFDHVSGLDSIFSGIQRKESSKYIKALSSHDGLSHILVNVLGMDGVEVSRLLNTTSDDTIDTAYDTARQILVPVQASFALGKTELSPVQYKLDFTPVMELLHVDATSTKAIASMTSTELKETFRTLTPIVDRFEDKQPVEGTPLEVVSEDLGVSDVAHEVFSTVLFGTQRSGLFNEFINKAIRPSVVDILNTTTQKTSMNHALDMERKFTDMVSVASTAANEPIKTYGSAKNNNTLNLLKAVSLVVGNPKFKQEPRIYDLVSPVLRSIESHLITTGIKELPVSKINKKTGAVDQAVLPTTTVFKSLYNISDNLAKGKTTKSTLEFNSKLADLFTTLSNKFEYDKYDHLMYSNDASKEIANTLLQVLAYGSRAVPRSGAVVSAKDSAARIIDYVNTNKTWNKTAINTVIKNASDLLIEKGMGSALDIINILDIKNDMIPISILKGIAPLSHVYTMYKRNRIDDTNTAFMSKSVLIDYLTSFYSDIKNINTDVVSSDVASLFTKSVEAHRRAMLLERESLLPMVAIYRLGVNSPADVYTATLNALHNALKGDTKSVPTLLASLVTNTETIEQSINMITQLTNTLTLAQNGNTRTFIGMLRSYMPDVLRNWLGDNSTDIVRTITLQESDFQRNMFLSTVVTAIKDRVSNLSKYRLSQTTRASSITTGNKKDLIKNKEVTNTLRNRISNPLLTTSYKYIYNIVSSVMSKEDADAAMKKLGAIPDVNYAVLVKDITYDVFNAYWSTLTHSAKYTSLKDAGLTKQEFESVFMAYNIPKLLEYVVSSKLLAEQTFNYVWKNTALRNSILSDIETLYGKKFKTDDEALNYIKGMLNSTLAVGLVDSIKFDNNKDIVNTFIERFNYLDGVKTGTRILKLSNSFKSIMDDVASLQSKSDPTKILGTVASIIDNLSELSERSRMFLNEELRPFLGNDLLDDLSTRSVTGLSDMLSFYKDVFNVKDTVPAERLTGLLKNYTPNALNILSNTYGIFDSMLKTMVEQIASYGGTLNNYSIMKSIINPTIKFTEFPDLRREVKRDMHSMRSALDFLTVDNKLSLDRYINKVAEIYDTVLLSKFTRKVIGRGILHTKFGMSYAAAELKRRVPLYGDNFSAAIHFTEDLMRYNMKRMKGIKDDSAIVEFLGGVSTPEHIRNANSFLLDIMKLKFDMTQDISSSALPISGRWAGRKYTDHTGSTKAVGVDVTATPLQQEADILQRAFQAVVAADMVKPFTEFLNNVHNTSNPFAYATDTESYIRLRDNLRNIFISKSGDDYFKAVFGENETDFDVVATLLFRDVIGMTLTGAMSDQGVLSKLEKVAPNYALAAVQLRTIMNSLTLYGLNSGMLGAEDVMKRPQYVPLMYYLAKTSDQKKMCDSQIYHDQLATSFKGHLRVYQESTINDMVAAIVTSVGMYRDALDSSVTGSSQKADAAKVAYEYIHTSLIESISNVPSIVSMLGRYVNDIATNAVDTKSYLKGNTGLVRKLRKAIPIFDPIKGVPYITDTFSKIINPRMFTELLQLSNTELVNKAVDIATDVFRNKSNWFSTMDELFNTDTYRDISYDLVHGFLIKFYDKIGVNSATSSVFNEMKRYAKYLDVLNNVAINDNTGMERQRYATDSNILKYKMAFTKKRSFIDSSTKDLLWVVTNPYTLIESKMRDIITSSQAMEYVSGLLQGTKAIQVINPKNTDLTRNAYLQAPDYKVISLKNLSEYGEMGKHIAMMVRLSPEFKTILFSEALRNPAIKEGLLDDSASDTERMYNSAVYMDKVITSAFNKINNSDDDAIVAIHNKFWEEFENIAGTIRSKDTDEFMRSIGYAARSAFQNFKFHFANNVLVQSLTSFSRNFIGAVVLPTFVLGPTDTISYTKRALKAMLSKSSDVSNKDISYMHELFRMSPHIPMAIPRIGSSGSLADPKLNTKSSKVVYAALNSLSLPMKAFNDVGFWAIAKGMGAGPWKGLFERYGFDTSSPFLTGARLRTVYGTVDEVTRLATYIAAREGNIDLPDYYTKGYLREPLKLIQKDSILKGKLKHWDKYNTKGKFNKMSPEEAVKFIDKYTFVYGDLPPAFRLWSYVGNPFISFAYNSGRILTNLIRNYPVKTAATYLGFMLMQDMLEHEFGITIDWGTFLPGWNWVHHDGMLPDDLNPLSFNAPMAKFVYMAATNRDPFTKQEVGLEKVSSIAGLTRNFLKIAQKTIVAVPTSLDLAVRGTARTAIPVWNTAMDKVADKLTDSTDLLWLASPSIAQLAQMATIDYDKFNMNFPLQTWYTRKLIDEYVGGKPIDRYGTQLKAIFGLAYAFGVNFKVKDAVLLESRLSNSIEYLTSLERQRLSAEQRSKYPMHTNRNPKEELSILDTKISKTRKDIVTLYADLGMPVPEGLEKYDTRSFIDKIYQSAVQHFLDALGKPYVPAISSSRR